MAQDLATVRPVGHLRLYFCDEATSKVPKSLSAVEQIGQSLWLGADEGASVERVATDDFANYAAHHSFALADFFNLPEGRDQEVDLEGLAVDPDRHRLWLVGSHSLRRGRPKGGGSDKDALKALRKVDRQANRYLLGYIELSESKKIPKPVPASGRAMAFCNSKSGLIDMLADSEQLAPFLGVPSKDNGFDIEGLAVKDDVVLLGLRGPVLRGWASILQLRLGHGDNGTLVPKQAKSNGKPYLHHVLDLGGLGIRDLSVNGEDLLILAGPTMDLDGPIRLYRWRDAFGAIKDLCLDDARLQRLFDIPWGSHVDHAEGVAVFKAPDHEPRLLIVYDSPADSRLHDGRYFEADLFSL